MPPDRKVRVFREPDGDVAALAEKTIAVIGYGRLGRALALNLRDGTPAQFVVADSSPEARERARSDGFAVSASVAAASAEADLVMLFVPDELQTGVFESEIRGRMRAGSALVVGSGYALTYGGLEPPAEIDVMLLAPRMMAHCLRELYLAGKGFYSYVSVEQEATRGAWPTLLALAKGSGSLRVGALHLTARQEADLDLFSEQGLGPWLGAAILAALQVGTEAGLPIEGLLLEMYFSGELAQSFQAMADQGFVSSTDLHGYASAYGGMLRSLSLPRDQIAASMREALEGIRSGAFAQALAAEVAEGYPCRALLEQMRADGNPITQAEKSLRARLRGG